MHCSRELDKSILPQPPHRSHPSRLRWGPASALRTSTVTKNARPKKIFPIFPHMARFLPNRALSERLIRRETDKLPSDLPVRTASTAPNLAPSELLISRSLLTKQSRVSKHIPNQTAGNKPNMRIPE